MSRKLTEVQKRESVVSLIFSCRVCSVDFIPLRHQGKRKSKFCSRTCYYDFIRGRNTAPRLEITCDFCSKVFVRLISNIRNGKQYCSHYCNGKARPPTITPESIEKQRQNAYWKGKKIPEDVKRKIRATKLKNGYQQPRGADNPRWKGVSSEMKLIRQRKEYKEWRSEVFGRDNYTCQGCGDKNYIGRGVSVTLQADHIKPFALFPELRFELSNGRTLCVPCHKKTDTYGGKMKNYVV